MESCFTFSFSPIPQLSQYHRSNPRSKPLSPCSVKTSQYRVRKCVHEGKPRATIRLRVNPITSAVQSGQVWWVYIYWKQRCAARFCSISLWWGYSWGPMVLPSMQLQTVSVTLWFRRLQCLVLRSVLSVFINLRYAERVCSYYGLRVCS